MVESRRLAGREWTREPRTEQGGAGRISVGFDGLGRRYTPTVYALRHTPKGNTYREPPPRRGGMRVAPRVSTPNEDPSLEGTGFLFVSRGEEGQKGGSRDGYLFPERG